MAWQVGDGFDFYASAADAALNTAVWATVSACVIATSGTRFSSGNGMQLGNNSVTAGSMTTATFTNSTTIYVNFNFKTTTAHVNGGTTVLLGFSWMDGATKQGGLFLRNGGDFVVTNGASGGAILATSGVLCALASTWYHIEAKIVVNNATGTVEIRMNGNTSDDFSSGSIDTRNGTANPYANAVNIVGHDASSDTCDDFYVFNDQGAAPNTWQGDVRAVQQFPVTDSAITWTRNTGPNNCLAVDDPTEDGDTTYVSTATPNNVDTYGFGALATTPYLIVAVVPRYMARMDDAGPHTVNASITSGGTTATLANYNCTSSYVYQQGVYTLDPNTSAAWSAAAVNALLGSLKDVL